MKPMPSVITRSKGSGAVTLGVTHTNAGQAVPQSRFRGCAVSMGAVTMGLQLTAIARKFLDTSGVKVGGQAGGALLGALPSALSRDAQRKFRA